VPPRVDAQRETARNDGAEEAMGEAAFVAGATGYTGRAVVAALRARGVPTAAHVRPDSPQLERWRADFGALGAEVDATPWDAEALTATFRARRPTLLFALLGTTRTRAAREGASYETVDYGLTAMLLRAALAADLRPRFVYLSAAGVGPRAAGAYMQVRWRFERELAASGVPYTIARPSFITGPDRDEDRPAERFAARASDGLLALAGALGGRKLRDRYHSTTNAVLGEALVRLALDPAAANSIAEGAALR
jgi:uncharacterized protein YbjT (DUF2867 family)